MIEDRRSIEVGKPPERVFETIVNMPNKFPTFRFLDARPFLFVRIALVDGLRAAVKIVANRGYFQEMEKGGIEPLKLGDSIGPFKLTGIEKDRKYHFTLDSFFFRCMTGYSLQPTEDGSVLTFDLLAEEPRLRERIWWFFIKPFHAVLANKVLQTIKKNVEHAGV